MDKLFTVQEGQTSRRDAFPSISPTMAWVLRGEAC